LCMCTGRESEAGEERRRVGAGLGPLSSDGDGGCSGRSTRVEARFTPITHVSTRCSRPDVYDEPLLNPCFQLLLPSAPDTIIHFHPALIPPPYANATLPVPIANSIRRPPVLPSKSLSRVPLPPLLLPSPLPPLLGPPPPSSSGPLSSPSQPPQPPPPPTPNLRPPLHRH
jgi:hypothetical protein